MSWTLTPDVEAYARAVSELFGADPVRHSVLMTVLASLVKHGPNVYGDDPPILAWWSPDASGPAQAAVLRTPPHPMHLSNLPESAVAPLVTALLAAGVAEIGSVIAAEPDATVFAAAWSAATGEQFSVQKRQRLYRLDGLIPLDPGPAGWARIAAAADERVVRQWDAEFAAETGQSGGSGTVLIDRLSAGRYVLWEADGEPASIASVTEMIGGVARVGQVYTPPDRRGRGYGGAVTVAATKLVLDQGAASVVLFTDLANPISNSLYLKLGYRPVEDRVLLASGQG
ncbi:MAG TPA: GNAT family N-acetyltransferase [Streptosporangiaceae bacterium]|nr:GNAT family N-acetyltransferase [Streptosporangiaceae bacterium]